MGSGPLALSFGSSVELKPENRGEISINCKKMFLYPCRVYIYTEQKWKRYTYSPAQKSSYFIFLVIKWNHTWTFFLLSLARNKVYVQRNWKLDIRHFILQKRNWKKKTLFGHFDQKQRCSVFTFVQFINIFKLFFFQIPHVNWFSKSKVVLL